MYSVLFTFVSFRKDKSRIDDLIFDSYAYSKKLYAKTLLKFRHQPENSVPFAFSAGDPVVIHSYGENPYTETKPLRGLIFKVNSQFISISFNNLPRAGTFNCNEKFYLTRDLKDIQYKRIKAGLHDLVVRGKTRRLNNLSKRLLGIENDDLPFDMQKCMNDSYANSDYVANAFDRLVSIDYFMTKIKINLTGLVTKLKD